MFDKHLKRWHQEKVYTQKQNFSVALLSKKERQNLFINFGAYNCCPIKITILVLESNKKVFALYWDILPLSLTGRGQYVLSTKLLDFSSPNNVFHILYKITTSMISKKPNRAVHGYSEEINSPFQCLDLPSLFIPSYSLKCSLLDSSWFRSAFNHLPEMKFGIKKVFPICYVSIHEPTWAETEFNYTVKTLVMQQKRV